MSAQSDTDAILSDLDKGKKGYSAPALRRYGKLTSLTAGGSGNKVEGKKGTAAKKRP